MAFRGLKLVLTFAVMAQVLLAANPFNCAIPEEWIKNNQTYDKMDPDHCDYKYHKKR